MIKKILILKKKIKKLNNYIKFFKSKQYNKLKLYGGIWFNRYFDTESIFEKIKISNPDKKT